MSEASLVYRCVNKGREFAATLYTAIAAYTVTANPLSKINHRAYVTMILISEWPVDHLHTPSIYSIDLMVDEL